MKYTEGLFKIPIKIYREKGNLDNWVRGFIAVPADSIVGYRDDYDPDRTPEEVANKGFDGLIVYTTTFGNLECTWKMERFESELDVFIGKYEKGIEKLVSDMFEEKSVAVTHKKTSWWRKKSM